MEAVPPIDPIRRDQIPRLCVLLGRAEREVRRRLTTALAGQDLTTDEFLLLAACDAAALPGQTELTNSVALSAAQTSTLLERLRQRDWLVPGRDGADRRRQVWGLTPLGRTQLEQAWQVLEPELRSLTARLPAEAWASLTCTLDKLLAATPAERKRAA